MLFTVKTVRNMTNKTNKKTEKEIQKEVKSVIRTIKASIRRASKKGFSDFRCKIGNVETYKKARIYFVSKGFRCWEYTSSEDIKYLAIAW